MIYLSRTPEQNEQLAAQKLFLETKFNFKVHIPQFDKVPHLSQLIQSRESGLISTIEEILLTHRIIDTKFQDLNKFKELQQKYASSQCDTYEKLNEFSILRANRIGICYMNISALSEYLQFEFDPQNDKYDTQLENYHKLNFQEKIQLSKDLGNLSYQFLETTYNSHLKNKIKNI